MPLNWQQCLHSGSPSTAYMKIKVFLHFPRSNVVPSLLLACQALILLVREEQPLDTQASDQKQMLLLAPPQFEPSAPNQELQQGRMATQVVGWVGLLPKPAVAPNAKPKRPWQHRKQAVGTWFRARFACTKCKPALKPNQSRGQAQCTGELMPRNGALSAWARKSPCLFEVPVGYRLRLSWHFRGKIDLDKKNLYFSLRVRHP